MTSYSPVSMATPLTLIVDASVAVRAVLPVEEKPIIQRLFEGWHEAFTRICAPDILLPEAMSVIRRGIFERWISEAEGQIAVEDIFRLGMEVISSDTQSCLAALAWAGRLGQSKAYDGFYLALAERLNAELWTADKRLFNRAKQLGVDWVRWIG